MLQDKETLDVLDSVQLRDRKSRTSEAVQVALLGAGWFGSGLVQEMAHWPGIRLRALISRNVQRAEAVVRAAGFNCERIGARRRRLFGPGETSCFVADELDSLDELNGIDLVFDATGDILFGARAALMAFERKLPFATISSELDATLGLVLKTKADEQGVVYTNCDGDQPGVLARMIDAIASYGFRIVAAGNCKGFLDVHKTPPELTQWVRPGQNLRMITAFTDGTKQGLELAALANGYGLVPDVRGMHGLCTSKARLVDDFLAVLSGEGIVDYCLGINGVDQGAGVFVIAAREGARIAQDMEYLKKGKGPHYLFFRDHHLCYIEAPRTILAAAAGKAVLAPQTISAEVFAAAKKDLRPGDKLDGIGGFTVYGVIEAATQSMAENLLPIGLAEYAVARKAISRDTPLTFDMVEFPEGNLVLELDSEQRRLMEQAALTVSDKKAFALSDTDADQRVVSLHSRGPVKRPSPRTKGRRTN